MAASLSPTELRQPTLTRPDIREADVSDLPSLHAAAMEFYDSSEFLHSFDIEKFVSAWTRFLELGFGVIFIAESCLGIDGALGGIVHPDLYGPRVIAEEFFWFIRESRRGNGVRLYRRFEEWSVSRGAVEIQMVHLLDLMPEKLSRFYERSGFSPIEMRYSKRLGS